MHDVLSVNHHSKNTCPQCNLTACSNFYFFPWKEILKTLEISKCQASRSWVFFAAWLGWVPSLVPRCPMNGRWPVGHPRSSQPPGLCRVCGTTVLEMLSELGTADLITPSWSWKVSRVLPKTSGWWWYVSDVITEDWSRMLHAAMTRKDKSNKSSGIKHVRSVERGGSYAVI